MGKLFGVGFRQLQKPYFGIQQVGRLNSDSPPPTEPDWRSLVCHLRGNQGGYTGSRHKRSRDQLCQPKGRLTMAKVTPDRSTYFVWSREMIRLGKMWLESAQNRNVLASLAKESTQKPSHTAGHFDPCCRQPCRLLAASDPLLKVQCLVG